MKPLTKLLTLGLLLLQCNLHAQSYKTSVVNTGYKNLEHGIVLTGSQPWKNPSFRIAIPFNYHYFNRAMDSIYIGPYGVFFTLDQKDVLITGPYDATDRGNTVSESPISYEIARVNGSRVLKIEWKNVGFYKDSTHQDYYNVQVWLYEGSENMEVHIGPTSICRSTNCQAVQNKCSFIFMSNFDGTEELTFEGPQESVKIEKTPCKSNEMYNIPGNGVTYCVIRNKER
jgi:hypothetical protein